MAGSVLLAAWLTLHWGLLPRLEGWKPRIEERASAALGVALTIGRIEVRTGGWIPVVDLHDVRLAGPDGAPALVLPHVRAALSPRSLLGLTPRFAQLFVDGPQLDIRRDALGRIWVGGLQITRRAVPDGTGADPGDDEPAAELADWFFRQSEFVVRDGRVRWTDEQRLAPAVELLGVTLVVRNSLRRHDVRLDATPSSEWGERFSLRGRFTQDLLARPSDWRRWSGSLYADLPHADLQTLRRHVSLPVEVQEGDGALRAWIELRDAVVVSVTADLALREVAVRLAPTLEPMALTAVTGRVVARRGADSLHLELQRVSFAADGAEPWPASDLTVTLRQRQAGGLAATSSEPVTGGDFRADRIDLAVLARLAERLPLGEALHDALVSLNPQGVLTALSGRWEGPLDAPQRYRVALRGEGLSLQAGARPQGRGPDPQGHEIGRPGFHGASVDLQATERGGEAVLSLQDGAVEFPGLFSDPVLAFRELRAPLQWTLEPAAAPGQGPRIQIRTADARFANADLRGSLSGRWSTGPGRGVARDGRVPGLLDLDARIVEADAARVSRYLPLGIPANTRQYLDHAIQEGRLTRGVLQVRGPLWDFPFFEPAAGGAAGRAAASQAGEFKVSGRIDRARFAFVPSLPALGSEPAWASPWPAMEDLSADLAIERGSLTLSDATARVGALRIVGATARIPELGHDARVLVKGRAGGPAADWLAFVAATPVRDWTRGALDGWKATGDLGLLLDLDLPLDRLAASRVRGQVDLAGNELRIGHGLPVLGQAKGRVDFTEQGFRIQQASVRAVGGEALIEGGSEGDSPVRLKIQGTATAEGLRRTPELGFVARAAQSLSGSAAYQVQYEAGNAERSVLVTSSLVGLVSELPPPLRKDAASPLPLRYQLTSRPQPANPGSASLATERDQLRVDLGSVVQARYSREWTGEELRVLRGSLAIGAAGAAGAPAEAGSAGVSAGVSARIRLPLVDLDAWRPVLTRVFAAGPELPAGGAAGAAGEAPAAAPAATATAPDPHAPTELVLQADQLQLLGHRVNAVQATWWPQASGWRAQVEAREAEGRLEWREEPSGDRLRARLTRLDLARSPTTAASLAAPPTAPWLGTARSAPGTPPSLDLAVDEVSWQGQRLGRLEVEAGTRAGPLTVAPGGREWRIARLVLQTPEARLTATGPWRSVGDGVERGGALDFRLDLTDTGTLLERLTQERSIRGGRGVMTGSVQWLGSPLWPDFASLGGRVQLALESGQFLKVDPGAGRLLGVLSLQALPRRLALDFRDVFQEGFAFDAITGDVSIEAGIARTRNLAMRGVQAAVLMDGEADLQRETQDLRVVVVPEINAGTASLAYAAINPAIGVGTFLAQLFLRRPLAEAGTREFHVSGSWADPKVERVARSPGPENPPPSEAGTGSLPRPEPAAASQASPPSPTPQATEPR